MKKTVLISALLGVAGLAGGTLAHAADDPCYEKAQTQSQLTACAADALKRQDQELNRLYGQMQSRLKRDDPAKALLTQAQRQWIGFRDAECAFAAVRSAGGSIHAMNVDSCLAELTRNRVIELQNHLACGKGADEQSALDCAIPR